MCADAADRRASSIRFAMRRATARRRLRGCAGMRHRMGASACMGFRTRARRNCWRRPSSRRDWQCIAPHMTAADLYHGWFYHQGALRLSSSLGWGIQMLREDARRHGVARGQRPAGSGVGEYSRAGGACSVCGRIRRLPIRHLPSYVRDWFAHREPGEYWAEQDISTRLDRIQIPALHIAGWFDTYLEGRSRAIVALAQTMRGASLRARINT